jgi:hypothetical protein
MASPARVERATPAFGRRCSRPLSYGEMCVDGRSRTCTLRFRRPAPSPFGHVDINPRRTMGTARPVRRDAHGGSGGNRTPCVGMTAGLQPAAPHGATDPCRTGVAAGPEDASAVVKVLLSRLVAGRIEAGSEGVEPPAGGVGDRGATVARARGRQDAHAHAPSDTERAAGSARSAAPYQRTTGLPALAASRRPGVTSWSRDRPGWHAYAPKLDRAWPWSVRSTVSMRAIGRP